MPLDATFRDETGKAVRLGDYFGKKPVVLSLVYFACPMLCGLSMQGLASSLKGINLDAGRDFEVLTVSFDPRDTPEMARAKKETAVARYGRAGRRRGLALPDRRRGVDRGASPPRSASATCGTPRRSSTRTRGHRGADAGGQHRALPLRHRVRAEDLRLSLVEASKEKLGTVVDQLLLLCYHYDPKAGRYGAFAIDSMRGAGAAHAPRPGRFVIVLARPAKKTKNDADTSARRGA